jgi:toxin-antitoxin system PIN domain toxin
VNEDSPLHGKAKSWLESALSGTETVGLPWTVLLAFLRLTTRSGVFTKPLPVRAAIDVVEAWLAEPAVVSVEPTPQHIRVLRDLLIATGTAGNLTSDAHVAALAIEHGAELCSCDIDFQRFPRLRWRNPLA